MTQRFSIGQRIGSRFIGVQMFAEVEGIGRRWAVAAVSCRESVRQLCLTGEQWRLVDDDVAELFRGPGIFIKRSGGRFVQCSESPPQIFIACPVIPRAPSVQRYATSDATSSG